MNGFLVTSILQCHCQRAHRVLWLQPGRLGLVSGQLFGSQVFLIDHDLIHILVEPAVGHEVIAVLARLLAPAVLNTPVVKLL